MGHSGKFKYIFFDLDGTLLDSVRAIVASVNHVRRTLALPEKPLDEVRPFIGFGVRDLIKNTIPPEIYKDGETALLLYSEHYRDHAMERTTLMPGAADMLERLKDKHMGIVTNRSRKSADRTLAQLNIRHYFKEIVGGDDVDCLKPLPCPVIKAITALKVTDKAHVLMVGDMAVDIQAGKAAGVHTCGVTFGIGLRNELEAARPEFIIDSYDELISIVK